MAGVGVKICGLKTEAMIDVAVAAGADMIGLVVFPKSPRHVELSAASDLAAYAARTPQNGARRAETVVLLVEPDDDLVRDVARRVRPDWIQLHGKETPARVAAIRSMTGLRLIKAVAVEGSDDLAHAAPYREANDLLLFDAKPPRGAVLPGGNGIAFDWSILTALPDRHFMLSGGLTPVTVAEAIRVARPAFVDVSSGVERAPGEKDAGLIRAFIAAAKAA